MKDKSNFVGVLFIITGILVILNKLGYLGGYSIFNIFLTGILIGIVIKSIFSRNFFGIFISLGIILSMYTEELGLYTLNTGVIIASSIFFSIGFTILFGKKNISFKDGQYFYMGENDIKDEGGYIYMKTNFSEGIKYLKSDNLGKVDLKCKFGNMKIFFDNVELEKNSCIVNIDANFAEVQLYVPKEWLIEDEMNMMFAGLSEKNRPVRTSHNKLTLVGDVNFAGVEVVYI